MRAPMCYVLAVVLRIIPFSVSMGFPINLKSTPARSASINRPNSRALVGRPHHSADLTLFYGVTCDLRLTPGRVAGLWPEVEALPGTILESSWLSELQISSRQAHSLAWVTPRCAPGQELSYPGSYETKSVPSSAGIRASANSGEVVQVASTPWTSSADVAGDMSGHKLLSAVPQVALCLLSRFGNFLKDIFILSKVAPSVRTRVAVTGIREPGTPAVRTNTSYSSPRSSSCTAPAPGRAGGEVTTALPSPRWPELATHHRADFDGSLMKYVVRRFKFTEVAVVFERLALGLVMGLGVRAGGFTPNSHLALVGLLFVPGSRAVCIHCKDSIAGCAGGDDCPLFTDLAANVAIFAEKKLGTTPAVSNLLPPEVAMQFSRPVCEAIVGIACAPTGGQEIDFTTAAYATSQSVVQAAMYGHCSVCESAGELARRLDDADTELAASKIRGAMDSLKIVGDTVAPSVQGLMAYLWAKVSEIISKRVSGVTRLVTAGKGRASDFVATLSRPKTVDEFYELVHLFVMALIAFGLASPSIAYKFVDDVVFATIRTLKETWKVAFELVTIYNREIDVSAGAVTIANVFRRGGQDTLLAEARRNAVVFFRPLGGNPRPEGGPTKATGKFDSKSTKACVDFNMGRPCKRLSPDGVCMFNHKCNQFVSDKGSGGVCFGNHARCDGCDYDPAKKLNKAQP